MSLVFCLTLVVSSASADVTETKEYNYELKPGGRISLSNVNGDVHIKGVAGNQVHIIATKKADNQEYLDGLEIEIDATDDRIRIETDYPKGGSGWFRWGDHEERIGGVSFDLTVPASAELDTIETVNGGITVTGVKGSVTGETVNGKISLEGLANDARLETVNGTIDAQFDVLGSGQRVNVDAVNGRIVLRLPENASAEIHAETLNGGIDADDFGLKPERGFVGRDLDGSVGDGEARINVDTVNGSVTISRNK
jgi:DUF4097 and DUF4098 domain-containing protein YvlB